MGQLATFTVWCSCCFRHHAGVPAPEFGSFAPAAVGAAPFTPHASSIAASPGAPAPVPAQRNRVRRERLLSVSPLMTAGAATCSPGRWALLASVLPLACDILPPFGPGGPGDGWPALPKRLLPPARGG